MDLCRRRREREKPDKMDILIVWLQWYEVLEQVGLIYNDVKQGSSCLEWVQGVGNDWAGAREHFLVWRQCPESGVSKLLLRITNYFRPFPSSGLGHNYSAPPVEHKSSRRQHVNERAWLHSATFYLWTLPFEFHMYFTCQEILFFKIFFNHMKT